MRVGRLCITTGLATVLTAGAWAQSSTETYKYDALGRLIEAKTAGGQNSNEAHSICYDPSGNRTRYKTASDGSSANCPTGAPTPAPSPTPTPTPTPPANNPPVTVADSSSGVCDTTKTVNLTANDTDPEGNYPLSLVSISRTSGAYAGASVVSASSVSVDFGPFAGTTYFTYTVRDSLGASATGTLTTTSAGSVCGA